MSDPTFALSQSVMFFRMILVVSPLVLYGMGLAALLAAAVIKPSDTVRLVMVRFVGRLLVGIGLLATGLFYGLTDIILGDQLIIRAIIFAFGIYLGNYKIQQAFVEMRDARRYIS